MLKGRLLFLGLSLPFLLFACYFTSVDPEAFDHVATAASFARGEGTIASAVAGTGNAEAGVDISDLRVAYVDEGDLWLWTEVGGAIELYNAVQPISDVRLSDDGQLIAFLSGDDPGDFELWVLNSDGSDQRVLLDMAGLDALTVIELSSDAVSQLLTEATNSPFSKPEVDRERILFGVLHPDGGSWDLWLRTPDGETILIASPVGENIVFDFADP